MRTAGVLKSVRYNEQKYGPVEIQRANRERTIALHALLMDLDI